MMASKDVIWITRHGEREDVADLEWINKPHRSDDDTPLAAKGLVQAAELGERLKAEHIDYIFSSPFDRCVNTAQIISSLRETPLSIKIEPGICEVLYDFPPGYLSLTELKLQYPLVDMDYTPALIPDKWEPNSSHCIERVQMTVKKIRHTHSGSILGVRLTSRVCKRCKCGNWIIGNHSTGLIRIGRGAVRP
uniref:Phosphoglycerate mutase n=1 Tax=Plectus sambesii TaxID=2011161 RepID=A0A914VTZ3_9BILA